MAARAKFIVGGVVIIGALAWMGFVAFEEGKAYYITVDEYGARKEEFAGKPLRIAGDVDSVDRTRPEMEFILSGLETKIRVRYAGTEFVPDTFKEGARVLVEGIAAVDGIFQARHIEAKCASKYEAEYEKRSVSLPAF